VSTRLELLTKYFGGKTVVYVVKTQIN
jgi:hypothetical protein